MIKSFSFIVLTHFFQFNELKIFKVTRLLTFFKLNHQFMHFVEEHCFSGVLGLI